jgi:hypothetical protein
VKDISDHISKLVYEKRKKDVLKCYIDSNSIEALPDNIVSLNNLEL